MKSHSNVTLRDVNEQQYFDFTWDFDLELTAEEKSLLFLLRDLDYSRFKESRLGRHRKVSSADMACVIVYCVMMGRESTRGMERLVSRDMFLRALLGPVRSIDHTTIDRFITGNMDAIEDLFYQMVNRLGRLGELGKEVVFQDGTKIESRAGRYTFVWKTALGRNMERTVARIMGHCGKAKELGLLPDRTAVDEENCHAVLSGVVEGNTGKDLLSTPSTGRPGRGHRADPVARLLRKAEEDLAKLRGQEETALLIGDGRRSLSKTDTDATFMRMKEDHMRNGQLKPAYNLQNAVDGGYVVGATISSARTDYSTCIPTMEKLRERLEWTYEAYAADSGYDCNENFRYLEKEHMTAYIKPQDWETSKRRRYRNDIGRYQNMEYDEDSDTFRCANNRRISPTGKVTRKGGTAYVEYRCGRGCKSCPLRKECMKNQKGDYKRFSLNPEHWNYRKRAHELLSTDKGVAVRINRSIQAEGSFAQMKSNMGKRRFLCFGKQRVLTEWLLVAFALNVSTFASRVVRGRSGSPQWYSPEKETA